MSINKPLPRQFFNRPAEVVGKELLGKFLVRTINGNKLVGKIVEVEAYLGKEDLAAHASKGITKRTEVLFSEPGRAYVYQIHQQNCLNVVTETNRPSCVLFRALEPISGAEQMQSFRPVEIIRNLTNGPGKLCQAMNITKELYATELTISSSPLYIAESGQVISKNEMVVGPRIGISKAKDLPLRFLIKDNPFVSR